MLKGGHPQLVLIHYSRGQSSGESFTRISGALSNYVIQAIIPALMGQPMRAYPLRQINEPRMYVLGEKAGQKIYTQQQQHATPHAQGMPGMQGIGQVPANMQHQAALLAAKNRDMESLERRQARERGAGMAGVRLC